MEQRLIKLTKLESEILLNYQWDYILSQTIEQLIIEFNSSSSVMRRVKSKINAARKYPDNTVFEYKIITRLEN